MAKTHDLKCWPDVFQLMLDGKKTFEYRKNDRDYQEGDTLHLREWCPQAKEYSGATLDVAVLLVLEGGQFGIPPEYCIMQTSQVPQPLESLETHDERVREGERGKHHKEIENIQAKAFVMLDGLAKERDALLAENERLKADLEAAKAAAEHAGEMCMMCVEHYKEGQETLRAAAIDEMEKTISREMPYDHYRNNRIAEIAARLKEA